MTDEVVALHHESFGVPVPSTVPLLLAHGGGSTIGTNFGALAPVLARSRQVVAVELPGHGHTPRGTLPNTFENSAGAVVALLDRLDLGPVDVLGFSNGGQVAMRLAIGWPGHVRRLIVASAPWRRDGMVDGFWDGLAGATLDTMPAVYLEADRAINPDPTHQQDLFALDRALMLEGFTDWPASDLAAITAPTLLVVGDRDVVRVGHVVDAASLIRGSRLLVVPGHHGDYLGEVAAAGGDLTSMHATVGWLLRFLDDALTDPAGPAAD